ncbi:DoxX family protein [Arthrobacter gengyunqii]|uniref:DoxX family protein n=1 Tax=Arthrobacter gengyunqii TaxID=2886940 RepID=A0A9X1M4N3_9MICC|nr:DoxX family protein [Arthrobacter gengyunqii]MCC3270815.1 DoxX family protein [Arthrobacter gengyunqii]UOY96489.1 DoxX family protein [Arthrobacter gengyunqii]
MMDIGVIILRFILGAILLAHAGQKLFGWFGGNGFKRQAIVFEALGLKPGQVMVAMAGAMELAAASLLVLGLATPLGALIGSGTMLVAGLTMQTASGKFWNAAGGGEYPYVLFAFSAAVGILGGGRYSVDRLLTDRWPNLATWLEPFWIHALAIPLLALASALPFAMLVRRGRTVSS